MEAAVVDCGLFMLEVAIDRGSDEVPWFLRVLGVVAFGKDVMQVHGPSHDAAGDELLERCERDACGVDAGVVQAVEAEAERSRHDPRTGVWRDPGFAAWSAWWGESTVG